MIELVLASQSPRRQELLAKFGYPFLTCPAVGEEFMDPSLSPCDLVQSLAREKALEVGKKHPNALVIGADTVVVLNKTVFGKPKDEEEAISMITQLQGNTHTVYTGVCLTSPEKTVVFQEATLLTMRPLSSEEIRGYVAQGESLDKAGGYGIQGKGAYLTQKIEGDFFNVMGLPLCRLGLELSGFGLHLFGSEGHI